MTQTLIASGAVKLGWTAVPGATSYTVTMTETTAAAVVQTPVVATVGIVAPATAPATTFTTAALNAGSTYAFSVSATTLSGTTAAASTGLSNSPTLPPVAFAGWPTRLPAASP